MSFAKTAASIAGKENLPMASADKILAAGARNASAAAKKKNPNLLKVSGVKKKSGAAPKFGQPASVIVSET